MTFHTKRINLSEICTVERAIPGKTYKAGTCYIKLSAVDEEVGQIHEQGEISERYAAIEPKDDLNTDYLYIVINHEFPEFLRRYRTTINLQADALKHFTVYWHENVKEQAYIVESIKTVQKRIDQVKSMIDKEKEVKKWYMTKMFPRSLDDET